MSLYIASLNSGSNGNCYYIGNDHEAVLVDVGISCKETEKRMKRLGLSMQKVKAIFISHEHTDHISGLPVIAKKYQLPVFITPGTMLHGKLSLELHLINHLKVYDPVCLGDLCITAFPKFHDAAEPCSFIISCKEITVGVFTDIGAPCDHVINHFSLCHAAFLEANYDDDMLEQGRYPFFLKRRIRGGKGHLSNKQALEVFLNHKPTFMSHLLLAHLSKDNNSPELVKQLFDLHAGETMVIVASRYQESEVYNVKHPSEGTLPEPLTLASKQYSLF